MINLLAQEITQERFRWEEKCLGEFAFPSKRAIRKSDREGSHTGEQTDLRNPFAHDTDRIIHSHSYARYMDKTQVFFQIKNDHITRRSLHVQMVSRIARTIGRCLGLNEDLIEAIAVGHDIGHTPFGHAGESVISKILQENQKGFLFIMRSLFVFYNFSNMVDKDAILPYKYWMGFWGIMENCRNRVLNMTQQH